MEEKLPGIIKSTNELKIYREAKVTMLYIYFSEKTQQKLFSVKVTPDMYQ